MRNVARNLLLLERIASGPPVTQSDLADEFGLSRSTTSDLLRDLHALGYVTLRNRTYAPGLRLLTFVMRARRGPQLAASLQTVLQRLCKATGETAICAVPIIGRSGSKLEVMAIDQVQSAHELRYAATLNRLYPADTSTTGQVLLAYRKGAVGIDPDLAADILDRGYGLGISDEGTATIMAVPILDEQGEPLAAISVIGPTHRMPSPHRDILPPLQEAARQLSQAAGSEANSSVDLQGAASTLENKKGDTVR